VNTHLNKKTAFLNLGLMDYQQAWDYQESLFFKTIELKVANRTAEQPQPTPNYLIFCQHPHVYTLGKSGDAANLLVDEQGLKEIQASYYKINRGGDITYHGPGQLVGYPIFDLENFFTDIHRYLRLIEEAIILTLAEYGLDAGRIQGLTGVWLDHQEGAANPRKICAIGVKTSRWVSMHGFAFNINSDLSYFKHIVPCGIDDKAVTSLAEELGHPMDFEEVSDKVKKHLVNLFGLDLSVQ
jgi:lipoyl(octanoyl) transferase